jgi:hypothetical protein
VLQAKSADGMIARALVVGVLLSLSSHAAAEAISQRGSESAAISALLRRAVAAAPANFATIRGKLIAANTYAAGVPLGTAFRSCTIKNATGKDGIADWKLECRSISHHRTSIDTLVAYLHRIVSTTLPAYTNYGRDDDSIGDFYVSWKAPSSPSVLVYGFVTDDLVPVDGYSVRKDNAYYNITIEHVGKRP